MKHWHLLGNGASNRYYTEQDGFIIGFNIPSYEHELDLIALIDTAAVRSYEKHGLKPRAPVITTKQCVEASKKHNVEGVFVEAFDVVGRRMNSAHCAVKHMLTLETPEQIHLWGFDSMYSEDLTSQMDNYYPRPARPPLNRQWHPHWEELMNSTPQVEWVLHIPKGETASVIAPNLKVIHH